jgi:L-serine dehydratase
MNIFDIIGPVMIGPSSSHTAGAVKLGNFVRNILGESPTWARITLYNSSDKAVAGILGDDRISFKTVILSKNHPHRTTVLGSSVGGGRVIVFSIDGFKTELSGDYNTIMTIHKDRPGIIAKVASFLAERKVNIARMRVSRESKAEQALMIIEMDEDIPSGLVPSLEAFEDIHKVVAIKRQ